MTTHKLCIALLALSSLGCSTPRSSSDLELVREVATRELRSRGRDVAEYQILLDAEHTYWRHTLAKGNASFYAQDPAFARVLGSCHFEVVMCLPRLHDGHMSLGGSFLILYATDDPTNAFVCAEK